MRYDDRLLTVLNQPAADRHDVAVRWRQLVDLIARAGPNGSSAMVVRAIEEIRTSAGDVGEDLRAAAARAVAALPLPLPLLEYFASDRLAVSAPVLAAANLEPEQWRALMRAADEETRRFIEALHPELKPELPLELTEILAPRPGESTPSANAGQDTPSLHEVVERIERRRRAHLHQRAEPRWSGETEASPAPRLFRWECGPTGEIAWIDGAPRGPLIGRSIARATEGGDRIDAQVTRSFAIRAPFRDAALTVGGEGPVAGEWKISGVPAFEPSDGRFAGYRGVALREDPPAPGTGDETIVLPDPNALRELVHEIKTPLNAIIGFAEIIDGQYLGPADRRYRERAAKIVAHAQILLTAIDDLDFAAKVHSSAAIARTDLGDLVEQMVPELRRSAEAKGAALDASRTTRDCTVSLEPELADRLVHRMVATIIDASGTGDRLRLTVDQNRSSCCVSLSLPAALANRSPEQLFGGGCEGDRGEGGFSLRLVRGLAHIASGEVTIRAGAVALCLPRG